MRPTLDTKRRARWAALLLTLAFGEAGAASEVQLGSPQIGQVRQMLIHYFTVRSYTPAVSVSAADIPERIVPGTPEDAARSHFSAMLTGNYERWLELWDKDSRALIAQRNAEENRGEAFWKETWRQGLASYERFELTRRVDVGEFVIIEFRASGAGDKEDLFIDVALTKDQNGRWRPTQALAADPVFHHWRRPGFTTETIVRQPPN